MRQASMRIQEVSQAQQDGGKCGQAESVIDHKYTSWVTAGPLARLCRRMRPSFGRTRAQPFPKALDRRTPMQARQAYAGAATDGRLRVRARRHGRPPQLPG